MRVIVLKFGGSVLRDATSVPQAVHEIYRWWRDGWRVVAVVSACAGKTDRLFREARSRTSVLHEIAAIVATGEAEAASMLQAGLVHAGLECVALQPRNTALQAEGAALDATLVTVDRPLLHQTLEQHGIVVLPGFTAVDAEQRTVLLGRGGSDGTALFLAHALGARCRLIKDVAGLYESDPSQNPTARRFRAATWEEVRRCGGSLVQARALAFAAAHAFAFEIASLHAAEATQVGTCSASLELSPAQRPLRVALLGAGTVGDGVLQHLHARPQDFVVTQVAVRDLARARNARREQLTQDVMAVAASNVDIVVEALGGRGLARAAILAALRAGSHVVTANKSVLATHGEELYATAQHFDRRLYASAAVGSCVPILEAARRLEQRPRFLRAVLNGTSNFVLERIRTGSSLAAAVTAAQRNGFAEANPSRDLDGLDAAEKLVLIARQLGLALSVEDVQRDGCTAAAWNTLQPGRLTRQIASLAIAGDRCSAHVALEELTPHDPFAQLPDAWNVVLFDSAQDPAFPIRGQGAGRWPTAEAVLADLLQLRRELELDATSNGMLQPHSPHPLRIPSRHAHALLGLPRAIPAVPLERQCIDTDRG